MEIDSIISDLHRQGYYDGTNHLCGFFLPHQSSEIIPEEFISAVETNWLGKHICFLAQVNSTNDYLSKLATAGAPHGTVVVAEHQTAGRGRSGHVWTSPPGSSLLFSILIRTSMKSTRVPLVTLAAAVGTARAIFSTTGAKVGIKWPNDLMYGKRKLSGILTEARFRDHWPEYIIVGIGINVNTKSQDWPEDIRETAVSLAQMTGVQYNRQLLLKRVCEEYEKIMEHLFAENDDVVIRDWTGWSITLGEDVTVYLPEASFEGKACGINEDGALIVKDSDGQMRTVNMGEISIRHRSREGKV